tara:strand:- start:426 stop:632 length:207 start_codon:yes stop_codon:yes gene_type:complete
MSFLTFVDIDGLISIEVVSRGTRVTLGYIEKKDQFYDFVTSRRDIKYKDFNTINDKLIELNKGIEVKL